MYKKVFGFFVVLILVTTQICAQSGGFNSPFSRFGIGDLADPNPIYLRHMGGVNAAFADNYHINHVNPASYSFLRATAFDIGLSANRISLSDQSDNNFSDWGGNLEYLSLAFPLRNPLNEVFDREKRDFRHGMGFSLIPISRVSYHILNDEVDPEIGNFTREFIGDGGIYKVQWGNSVFYKNLSVGINLGYQFGKITYERVINFDELTAFDNRFTNDYSLNSFNYNVGAIYQFILNKAQFTKDPNIEVKALNIGIYGNTNTSFSTNGTELFQNSSGDIEVLAIRDTLSFAEDIQGRGTLPAQLGVGANYYVGGSLSLGVNYVLTRWSQYENEANPEELSDASKLSFGGFYRPNVKSFNYRDRIYYRFGFSYGKGERSVNQEELDQYSINAGFGFPFVYQRKISHINLGIEFGQRSTGSLLSENFVKFGLGLTFNDDEWFIKRKYN